MYSTAARINVSGITNSYITGTGIFNVASNGIKIDNYSTRSLIFNEMHIDANNKSGLIIDGRNHAKFADKPQAVSGSDAYYHMRGFDGIHVPKAFEDLPTTGVHYVSGGDGSIIYEAQGINAYGPGDELSIDVLGVDPDIISSLFYGDSSRLVYTEQESNPNAPLIFHNDTDRIPFYDVDYRANTAVISINDYVNKNRGVSVDTLYANNAYINTPDTNFRVEDGYIMNYAELRNADKIAVVDNDFRRIVTPAEIQLYTAKTGSFALSLNDTINMKTTAPTVYNNPHMLVNGYHSAWNFVNRGFKENKDMIDNTKMPFNMDKNNYNEPSKRIAMRFDTTRDKEFHSNVYIYDISTTGALIRNDKKLKRGDTLMLNFKFDDVDVNVPAKVVDVEANRAGVEFLAISPDVANRILFRYMQRANSMKTNLTSYL